jgi:hypothetical protein
MGKIMGSATGQFLGKQRDRLGGAIGSWAGRNIPGASKLASGILGAGNLPGRIAGRIKSSAIANSPLGKAIGTDLGSMGTAVKAWGNEFRDHPGQFMMRLAGTKAGRIAVTSLAAMSGDPITILKAGVGQGVIETFGARTAQVTANATNPGTRTS